MGSHFREVEIPQQKQYNSIPLPCILSPNYHSVSNLVDSIKVEKPYLESLLHKSGAILFRGFPINTASDFNDVVEAFEYEEYPYLGGGALRTNIVGRVYTANESPLHVAIGFHNEMSYCPDFPSKLLFFCEEEPTTRGETPIVAGHAAYDRIKKSYPDFVQQLEERGLVYANVVLDEDDPSNPIGGGWKSRFSTQDKAVAEERAAKIGFRLVWMQDGVKFVAGPNPAIRYDKSRNQKIWFNNIALIGPMLKNGGGLSLTFGDGEPLQPEIVSHCVSILEEESVAFPWQKGDILLIDNWATLHGRKPSNPPRLILVSLCK